MTDQAPDVSVLIPVRNEARWIRDTAASMLAQEYDGSLEFLFVDGRSDDGTRDALEELAAGDDRVRVLDNPNVQVPHALNVGLREARGRYIARMDAHSWYPSNYVARAVARLDGGDVAWVTGPAQPVPNGRWGRWIALALASPLGQGGSMKWSGGSATSADPGEHDLDTGVFGGVWRRETVERLAGWDEEWSVNEDVEMAARVLEEGERIVCLADIPARYAPRDTAQGLARQYWRFGYYRVKTSRRHPIALRRSHLFSAALAANALAALVLPHRRARIPRAALTAYAAGLLAVGAQTPRDEHPEDAAGVPAALATMHLSWGLGFLSGCARFGPPIRAAVGLFTRQRA